MRMGDPLHVMSMSSSLCTNAPSLVKMSSLLVLPTFIKDVENLSKESDLAASLDSRGSRSLVSHLPWLVHVLATLTHCVNLRHSCPHPVVFAAVVAAGPRIVGDHDRIVVVLERCYLRFGRKLYSFLRAEHVCHLLEVCTQDPANIFSSLYYYNSLSVVRKAVLIYNALVA